MIRVFTTSIIIALLFSYLPSMSQLGRKVYKNGYVVTLEGDTLRGKIHLGSKLKLSRRKVKNVKKFKYKKLKAYKYGRHTFENINKEYYRLLIKGPVNYYINEAFVFLQGYTVRATYYCVKRAEEENVTVLYAKKTRIGGICYPSDNIIASLIAELATEVTIDITLDLDATNHVTILKDMLKVAADYFEDYPLLAKDIEDGVYNDVGEVRQMVERYNRHKSK